MVELAIPILVKSILEKLVVPKIKSLGEKGLFDYNKNLVPTEKHFKNYFEETYKKLSFINTLALKNTQRLLKDIYIPMRIIPCDIDDKEEYKIENYPKGLIDRYNKILITDTAGMGKSTLMKRIFLDIVDELQGIPIFIELRRLTKENTILEEIYKELDIINKEFDKLLLLELLAEGGFIFIFDGYDEIKLDEKSFVSNDLRNFITKTYKNKFILTSRPEQSLLSFGDFQEFKIKPLTETEAYSLLKKYDNSGHISKLLINKLKSIRLKEIKDFLTNPLLVSLLFTAFEYKPTIPTKKHLFYRQVFDAYFESHDLTKGDEYIHKKYTKLDIDNFERILRYLAYLSFLHKKIEFTKDELLTLLDKCREYCSGINFNSSDFIKDLIITVPLFVKDGINYKWSHKSLQEYFTVQYIYKDSGEKRSELLLKIYNSSNLDSYINILDIYYDVDYRTFRRTVIYSLLQEYKLFIDNRYSQKQFIHLKEELIKTRRKVSFLNDLYFSTYSDVFEITKELEKYFALNPNDKGELTYYFRGINNTNKIGFVGVMPSKGLLLRLLDDKWDELIDDGDYDDLDKDNAYNIIGEEDYLTFGISLEEMPVILKIDDSPNNIFNQDYFEKMNLIKINGFEIRFNHNIALSTLEQIKEEIREGDKTSYLFDEI